MKKTRVMLVQVFVLSGLALGGWFWTGLGTGLWTVQAKRAQQIEAQEKVAPWLAERFESAQQELEFLVILKDQADLRGADALPTKLAKGEFVRKTLWDKAQQTQAPLITWLKERNATHRSFYIMNALWVRGTRALASEIAARPEVGRVEGNPQLSFIRPVESIPEDASSQLTRSAQAVEPGISSIRADLLWQAGFKGQGVVVGGQDTGVDWQHSTLQSHYRGSQAGTDTQTSPHDYNWHDSIHSGGGNCGPDTLAPCDDSDHGTHTLGTAVGGDANNQIGVAPEAQFIACRNMDRGDGTPATYLECFEFMLAPYPVKGTPAQGDPSKAPDMTVNSWTCPPSEGCSPDTLRLAIEVQRSAGILTVVSAGNGGPSCMTVNAPPAHYAATYSIAAYDARTGDIARFSSRGPVILNDGLRVKPDISAPGVTVRSAVRNNAFAFLSGTSMAGPHVAGAIAVLWSARPELKNQIALTESLLNETAVRVNTADCESNGIPNFVYGFGRLDVKAAYDLAGAAVTLAATSVGAAKGELLANVTAPAGLKWRAVSQVPWLSLRGETEFSGDGTLVWQVAENTNTTARTGTIVIAGRPLMITQAGVGPYTVSGRVVDRNGQGLSRVTLSFSRVDSSDAQVPVSVVTADDGTWSQTGFMPNANYRVLATRSRQAFEPASYTFSAPLTTLNFSAVNRRVIVLGRQ
jgi:serine protease AprX